MQTSLHKSAGTQRINSLTGARFTAIMVIVFSHFEFLSQFGQFGEIYTKYFHNATLGTDFFFMLSGFGMMLSSIRQDPEGTASIGGISGLFHFGKNHIKKIYSIYIIFLALGIPYNLLLGYFDYGSSLKSLLLRNLFFFSVDLTLLQSSTGLILFSHSLNSVCWFLSTLFCIYLVSPIIMQILKRKVKTVRNAIILLMASILFSYLLAILFSWIEEHSFFTDLCYGSPYRRIFYVIPGMLLAQIYDSYKKETSLKQPHFLESGIFEYFFIVMSIIWFLFRNSYSDLLGNSVYLIDMILVSGDLFALAISRGVFSRIFANKRMVFLGDISMYIFLVHYNIRKYIDFTRKHLNLNSLPAALIEVAMILTVSFVISILIHQAKTKHPISAAH